MIRYLPHVLSLIGLLAVGFAYWGMKTAAGRRAFDEMAGTIPMAAGAIGVVCVVAGVVWLFVRARS